METDNLKKVIRIEDDETSINWEWEKDSSRIKGSIDILSMQYDVPILIEKNILPSDATVGDIFVKSPFENQYIKIEDYESTVLQQRIDYIGEVARMLGAKECNGEILINKCEEREIKAHCEIGYKNIDINSDIAITEKNSLSQKITINKKFGNGCIPSIESFNDADVFCNTKHLSTKVTGIDTLLRSRNPKEGNNLLTEHFIRINISSEINNNLDIAAELKVFDYFKLNAGFNKAVQMKKDVSIEMKLEFPDRN